MHSHSTSQAALLLPAPVRQLTLRCCPTPSRSQTQLTEGERKQRIGLISKRRQLPICTPLKNQLPCYETYCTTSVDFSRGHVGPMKQDTWCAHKDTISMYMGWLHRRESVALKHLSLSLFCNHVLWTKFMGFMAMRTTSSQRINNIVAHSVRVLTYLRGNGDLTCEQVCVERDQPQC